MTEDRKESALSEFTWLELLSVIAILTTLTIVSLPAIKRYIAYVQSGEALPESQPSE